MTSEQPFNNTYHVTSLSWINSFSLQWLNSLAWPTRSFVTCHCWYQHLYLSLHLIFFTPQCWCPQACQALFCLQAFACLFHLECSPTQHFPCPTSCEAYTHTYIFHFYFPSDLGLATWFSKCGPRAESTSINWELLEMQILRLHPRPTKSEIPEVGPWNLF